MTSWRNSPLKPSRSNAPQAATESSIARGNGSYPDTESSSAATKISNSTQRTTKSTAVSSSRLRSLRTAFATQATTETPHTNRKCLEVMRGVIKNEEGRSRMTSKATSELMNIETLVLDAERNAIANETLDHAYTGNYNALLYRLYSLVPDIQVKTELEGMVDCTRDDAAPRRRPKLLQFVPR